MSILKLKPACKDYIWGGHRLKELYNKSYDGDVLAETWELSCHPDGPSTVINGPYAGKTLREYIDSEGRQVLGANCQMFQDFPILIKFIDAKEDLSIQVHPDNTYALAHEGQYGKTEMWYVLEAEPDASLYYGFQHEITREELCRRIADNTLTEVLNAVPVHKGDLIYIPAGTIHAICRGVVIAEIQQSSNVTYRVYDHNRTDADGKPRPLHIEKAAEVAELTPPRRDWNFGGHLARSMYFTVDAVESGAAVSCNGESFTSLLILDGEGGVRCGNEEVSCRKGDSLFIPAGSGCAGLSGSLRALCTRVGTV